jgi:hypothetical protein
MASPYSCDNTGSVDIAAAIEELKANQSNVGTIYFPHGTYKLATNLTIPVGMRIEREAGAVLSIFTGVVLTFNGSLEETGVSFFTLNGTAQVDFSSNTVMRELPIGTWPITTDTTFSNNIKVPSGCIFSIATGTILTINGALDAGLYQIFSCTGTGKVAFSHAANPVLYPKWWGTVEDGTTDDYVPLQACIDAACATTVYGKTSKVKLTSAAYLTGTTLNCTNTRTSAPYRDGLVIEGSGPKFGGTTILGDSGDGYAVMDLTGSQFLVLRYLNIGAGSTTPSSVGIYTGIPSAVGNTQTQNQT